MAIEFTKEDKENIQQAIELIAGVQEDINRAKMAGFDIADREKQLISQRDQLLAIKQAFFPGG